MIITICLLILVFSVLKRPVGWLVDKLEDVDWNNVAQDAWDKIMLYSRKIGRAATQELLSFYFVLTEGNLSALDKALVYAGIIYIVLPGDLLPRPVLGWLGILDDVGVAAWIHNKIESRITPDIEMKVDKTLDDWFGYEVTFMS